MVSRDYFTNKIGYSDWDYHEKMKKTSEYEAQKSFKGPYGGNESKNYSFPISEFSSGSYKMAA